MRCPTCKSDTKVLETRYMEENNSMKRRRECLNCGKRFTTYEKLEDSVLMVQKKSGRMELFDKAKILNGVAKACEKRPIQMNTLQKMALEIENDLKSRYEVVDSKTIGEAILHRLLELDEVAYVRFASVYRKFDDIETFISEIESLREEKNNGGRDSALSGSQIDGTDLQNV